MLDGFNLITAAILLAAGAYMLCLTRFAALRPLRVLKGALGIGDRKRKQAKGGEGGMSAVQALFTALAGSIGTGNIAGVSAAIAIGGEGAIFWMWVSGILGMATKYAEVYIAVAHRVRMKDGAYAGGAMYVIKNVLGHRWQWLAGLFAAFTLAAAISTGGMVQVNTMASAAKEAAISLGVADTRVIAPIVGLLTAAGVGAVMRGGAKRTGRVAAICVPVMSAAYIAAALCVIIDNAERLPTAFQSIFCGAFGLKQAAGGVFGATVATAMRVGAARGIFSNEAGMGSAPMAYASADYKDARAAGYMGVIEVFVDTILICTLTALMVITSGVPLDYGNADVSGMGIALMSLETFFPKTAAGVFLAVSTALFAFSSIVGWSLYGSRAASFLLGERAGAYFAYALMAALAVGAVMEVSAVWSFGETANALMAMPNLAALFALRKTISVGARDILCYNKPSYKIRGKV